MSEFKIEDGIPIPGQNKVRGTKYPWKELQVGQSFFVPLNGKRAAVVQSTLNSAGKYVGMKVATRQVEGGVRVWRIG